MFGELLAAALAGSAGFVLAGMMTGTKTVAIEARLTQAERDRENQSQLIAELASTIRRILREDGSLTAQLRDEAQAALERCE